MKKEYKCVCGKTFDNIFALNGHNYKCKEFCLQKFGDLNYYNNRINKTAQAIKESKQNKINAKKTQWISEQHKCEHCGKIMTEYYGSGRFCSRACANSRKHSQETKSKISRSLSNKGKNNKQDKSNKLCTICNKEISYKNKTGYCINCMRYAPELKEYRI